MNNIPLSIGEKITYFRKQKGLSQEDLAHRLGKSRTTITMYESNKIEPTVTLLHELAKALEITLLDFLMNVPGNKNYKGGSASYLDELKIKIKMLEIEIEVLKREVKDKNKIISLHEKREADYDNQLNDLQKFYDEIVKKLR